MKTVGDIFKMMKDRGLAVDDFSATYIQEQIREVVHEEAKRMTEPISKNLQQAWARIKELELELAQAKQPKPADKPATGAPAPQEKK